MIDSVIFDLDGTLWDACRVVAESWDDCLCRRYEGLVRVGEQEVRSIMGMTASQIAGFLFSDYGSRAMEVTLGCIEHEISYVKDHPGRLYPGLEEVIKLLSEKRKLCIVSNCQDGYIQAFLSSTGLAEYFADFECSGRTGKSKGENIRLVARRQGLKSPVYVGDTLMDEEAAAEAAIPFVHAAYGFGRAKAPWAELAELSRLPQLLERKEEQA